MPASPVLHVSALFAFLLVLTRVSGIFVFLPLPGLKAGPDVAKITLSLAFTFALFSQWPAVNPPSGFGELAGWLLVEAGLGTATGLAVAFIIEGISIGAQALTTQAGFGFASTVDPNTEADSTVLIMLAQLIGAMLFFAMGLDRQLLGILSKSLETHPPGSFPISRSSAEMLVTLGSGVFSTGIRLALPVMTLLFLIEISIGLFGRLNAQLHLMAVSFPIKILAATAALSALVFLIPKLYQQSANASFSALARLLGL
jgi:flagellar biosynthetic protein FliR